MSGPTVVLQRRAHRTGAQVSLYRALASGALAGLDPHVVCHEPGWLTEAVDALGVPVSVHPMPSSRALGARLVDNRRFGRALAAQLRPSLVIGNDHPEGLLAQAVARAAGCPRALILRSFAASTRDLRKYACADAELVLAVGEAPRARAEAALGRAVLGFEEGLLEGDFREPAPPSAGLGPTILVVGTPKPDKGWPDLLAALEGARLPPCRWSFTADPSAAFAAPPGQSFDFVGRPEDYPALVRAHDLVVHPSRGETFGLAVAEAWAAGRPVLASETGIAPALPAPDGLRFAPGDVAGLRARLEALATRPPIEAAAIEAVQAFLRRRHGWPERLADPVAALARLRAGGEALTTGSD